MAKVIHVEVTQSLESKLKTADLVGAIREDIDKLQDPVKDFSPDLIDKSNLKGEVVSIRFSHGSTTLRYVNFFDNGKPLIRDETNFEEYQNNDGTQQLQYYSFKMNTESESADEEDKELTLLYQHWICPCDEFDKLWDSLQFSTDVKSKLLDYVCSVFRFSDSFVDDALVSLNKMVLLYGAPGTGKTSLCKAIAHKAAIRLGGKFDYGQLIQLNLQSCLPGSTAEGGCASTKLMEKLQELVEDKKSLVFVLIDDVDHFARRRSINSPEASESARSLHFLVNQLDRFRRLSNVVVLATSSMVESLDPALTDRADMKFYLESPKGTLLYKILAGSVNELLRSGFIACKDDVSLPKSSKLRDKNHPLWEEVHLLQYISELCDGFSARMLRKIAFLTYVKNFGNHGGSLVEFLKVMKRCVRVEKAQMDLMYDCFLSSSRQARKVLPTIEKTEPPKHSPPKPSTVDQATQTASPEMVSSETLVNDIDFQDGGSDLPGPTQGLSCVNCNSSKMSISGSVIELEQGIKDINQDIAVASADLPSDESFANTDVIKSEPLSNLESGSSKCVSDTETDIVCEESKVVHLKSLEKSITPSINYTRNGKSLNIRGCSVVLTSLIPTDILKKLLGDSTHPPSSVKLNEKLLKQLSKEIIGQRLQTVVGSSAKLSSLKQFPQPAKSRKESVNNMDDATIKNCESDASSSVNTKQGLEEPLRKLPGEHAGTKSSVTFTLVQDITMPTEGLKDQNSNMMVLHGGLKSNSPKSAEENGGKLKNDPLSSVKFVSPGAKTNLSPTASELALRARSTPTMDKHNRNSNLTLTTSTPSYVTPKKEPTEKLPKSRSPSFTDLNITKGRPGPQSYKDKLQGSFPSVGILRRTKNHTVTKSEPEVITVPDDNDDAVNQKIELSHTPGPNNIVHKPTVSKVVNQAEPALRQVYITDSMGKTTTVLQSMKKKMFDCDQCEFSFLFKRELNRHKITAHTDPKKLPCEFCQKQFASADGLRRHRKICASKKQAFVETKASVGKEAVKTENIISTGLKVQQYHNKFNSHGTKMAVSYPSGTKGAISNPPGTKAAISQSPGTTDVGSDAKKMKLGCTECDKVFDNQKDLERHKIFHQEARPFKCAKCPKTFKSESSLNFHVKIDHGQGNDFMYPCSVCGFLCPSESHADEHERTHHDSQNYVSGTLSAESTPAPGTPYSLTATEQSSSVSSVNNSSDYEHIVQGEIQLSGSRISQDSSAYARLSAEPMELPVDENYQYCSICAECLLGKQELLQHHQIYHLTSSSTQEIDSTCDTDFFSDSSTVNVPVPDVEQIIEVETTDQFLEFLSAF